MSGPYSTCKLLLDSNGSPIIMSGPDNEEDLTLVSVKHDPLTGGIAYQAGASTLRFGAGPLVQSLAMRCNRGSSRPVAVGFGNSIMQLSAPASLTKVYAQAIYYWAMAYLGCPFRFARTGPTTQLGADTNSKLGYGVYGYGGADSVQALPFLDTLLAYSPDIAFIHILENDVLHIASGTLTLEASKAAISTIIKTCLERGIVPVVTGSCPKEGTLIAGYNTAYWNLTRWLEDLSATTPDLIYVPVHDLYSNPAVTETKALTTGNYLAYVQSGSVHPYRASSVIGKRVADVLARLGLSTLHSPVLGSAGDPRLVIGAQNMASTGGTVTAPLTGAAAPYGYTCSSSVAAAITTGIETDGRPYVDFTYVGAATGLQQMFNMKNTTEMTTRYVTGDYVQTFVDFKILKGAANLRCPGARTQFHYGTSDDSTVFYHPTGDAFENMPMAENVVMRLMTAEVAVPAATAGIFSYFWMDMGKDAASVDAIVRVYSHGVMNWGQ